MYRARTLAAVATAGSMTPIVTRSPSIAVIGGGLAGLTAAYELAAPVGGEAAPRVTVLEGAERLGGQIATQRDDGFVIEHGAEGFAAGAESVLALCDRLGLGAEVVQQAEKRSLVLRGGALAEVEPGHAAVALGFKVPREDLGRGTATLRTGMGSLVESLGRSLGGHVHVRTHSPVASLAADGARWTLALAAGERLTSDAVLLAAPGREAAALLAAVAPEETGALVAVPMASSVTVSLALPRADVAHPLDASGFVVAGGADPRSGLIACGFSSSKYPHCAPTGWALLRAFFRPSARDAVALPEREWCERACAALAPVLGLDRAPARCWVSRWPEALAQPSPAHEGALGAFARRLGSRGAIGVAGAFYGGRGIDGAVRSATTAARALGAALGSP